MLLFTRPTTLTPAPLMPCGPARADAHSDLAREGSAHGALPGERNERNERPASPRGATLGGDRRGHLGPGGLTGSKGLLAYLRAVPPPSLRFGHLRPQEHFRSRAGASARPRGAPSDALDATRDARGAARRATTSERSPVRPMARSTRRPSSCGAFIRKGPSSRAPSCSPTWSPRRWWDMPPFTWACAVLCSRSPSSGSRVRRHFWRPASSSNRAKFRPWWRPRWKSEACSPRGSSGRCARTPTIGRGLASKGRLRSSSKTNLMRENAACLRSPGYSPFCEGRGPFDAVNLARPLGESASVNRVATRRRDEPGARSDLLGSTPVHLELAPRTGNHEGLGGWALACGAALVASGEASEVLVLGIAPDRFSTIVLAGA